MSVDLNADEVIASLRGQIATLDEAILRLVNLRVGKVAALRIYKQRHGLPDFDPAREAWLHQHLQSQNDGPLDGEAVSELLKFILDLSRRISRRAISRQNETG